MICISHGESSGKPTVSAVTKRKKPIVKIKSKRKGIDLNNQETIQQENKGKKSCENPGESSGKSTDSSIAKSQEPIVKIKSERNDFDSDDQQATQQENKKQATSTVIFSFFKF